MPGSVITRATVGVPLCFSVPQFPYALNKMVALTRFTGACDSNRRSLSQGSAHRASPHLMYWPSGSVRFPKRTGQKMRV